MLHLIPASLHRAAYRVAHALRRRWWRIRKPRLAGCRVVVMDGAGQVLLIRHSYGSGKWMLPGGGLNRGEAALAAAARELREETGCGLIDPVQLGIIEETIHGAGNAVHVIAGWTDDAPQADSREIIAAQFFSLDALPLPMPDGFAENIPLWITAAKAARLAL
jgi:8-oxo-dGTP pyrophosphatase MutT (NUDIX family)